ncbi:MAG: VWA domain-containing protein [Bacillota bacterium]
MYFNLAKPWFLLLLLLIIPFYFIYKKNNRKLSLPFYIRIVLLMVIVLALAQPQLRLPDRSQTVVFMADLSDSVSGEDKQYMGEFIEKALEQKEPEDKAGIIAFGEEAYVESPVSKDTVFTQINTQLENSFTNMESALRLGISRLPDPGNRRLVLLSDGEENQGRTAGVISELEEKNIAVDTVNINPERSSEVYVDDIILPSQKSTGENFVIKARIKSFTSTRGKIRLYRDEKLVEEKEIEVDKGTSIIEFSQQISDSGLFHYQTEIEMEEDEVETNNKAGDFINITGGYKVLIMGEDEQSSLRLQNALENKDIKSDIVQEADFNFSDKLYSYEAVILNNVPVNKFSERQLLELKSYVEDTGKGLIVTGGDNSFGVGKYSDTILEEMLPVNSDIETRIQTHTLGIVLVIDKSGSMREEKIKIARESAGEVVDLLLSQEKIGVVAFDTEAEVIVPLQETQNKDNINNQISSLESEGGGTDILSGLNEAYSILAEDDSALRHIILLSDGVSLSGDYESTAREIEEEGITLSTIAIGENSDTDLMSKLANWGNGRSYYTRNINSLPRIITSETERVTPSLLIEQEFRVDSSSDSSWVTEINWEEAPPLRGFVRTTPRELSQVHLKTPDNSPLLATWRYGLGNVAVFTSSIGGKWAQNWLDWEEYNQFWQQLTNRVINFESDIRVFTDTVRKGKNTELIFNIRDENNEFINFMDLQARIIRPDEENLTVDIEQTGLGEYRGDIPVETDGVYRIHLFSERENRVIHSTGIDIPYSPEYKFPLTDSQVMENLVTATGGRELNSPGEVFRERKLTFSRPIPVWFYLAVTALILFLIDLIIRLLSISLMVNIWTSVRSGWQGLKNQVKSLNE